MIAYLVLFGFLALVGVALISWFAIVIYGAKAIRLARPEVSPWSRATDWNPTNVLVRPELLTVEGRRYRARCFRAALVFVGCIALAVAVGAVVRVLK